MAILSIIVGAVINLLIIYFIIRFFLGLRGRASKLAGNLFMSKEDAAGQLFILLALFFLGVTLLVINSDLGRPLSLKTIVLITSAAGLVAAYRLKMIAVLPFALIGFQVWPAAAVGGWAGEMKMGVYPIFLTLLFANILYYLMGRIHDNGTGGKRASFVYTLMGLLFVTVSLFYFSTGAGLGSLADMTFGNTISSSWKASLTAALLALAVIGAVYYAYKKRLIHPYEAYAVFIVLILFGALAAIYQPSIFEGAARYNHAGEYLSYRGIFIAVVLNLLAFAELIGLIFLGYYRREEWLVNSGVLLLFVFIFVKYVDWFFKFMDKYLFFMGAGVLLFAVGWCMEKGRRRVITDIHKA